jgi:hypothetical protein
VLRIRDVYPGSRILIFTHSGSRIPDPGSRIPDPKTATKERGEKKISCHTFLCSHKFHKIVNYFIFEVLKKKIWANFQRIIELFTKKIVKKLLKIWSWDPGSEIRDPGFGENLFRIPDPGVKKHPIPDPGSRIRIRNTDKIKFHKRILTSVITHTGGYSPMMTTSSSSSFVNCSMSETK